MDYTIEVWSSDDKHFAQCNCNGRFFFVSNDLDELTKYVLAHKKMHTNNGNAVEVV